MIVDWGQTSLIEGSQQAKSNKETDKYGSDNSFGIQISSGRESREVSSLLFSCFSSGWKPGFSVAVENLLNGLSPRVPLSLVESCGVPLSPAESCWPSSHEALNNSYCCSDSTKYTHVPLSSSVRLLSNWGLTIPSSRIDSPIKLLFLLVCDSFECLLFKKNPTYKLTKVIGSIQQRPGSLSFESWLLLLNVQNSRVHNLTT